MSKPFEYTDFRNKANTLKGKASLDSAFAIGPLFGVDRAALLLRLEKSSRMCNRYSIVCRRLVLVLGSLGVRMLSGLLTALLILVALVLMVLVIVLQQGSEGGIGTAFGSGNSAGFFGASGGVSLIVRATWICGALFFGLSTALAWVKTREHFGVSREIDDALQLNNPPPAGVKDSGSVPAAAPGEPTSPGGAPASGVPADPAAVPAAPVPPAVPAP